jgi:hypothetical protein
LAKSEKDLKKKVMKIIKRSNWERRRVLYKIKREKTKI